MIKLQFAGVGSAFTLPQSRDLNNCDFQSNVLITSESGKKMMIDYGSDARFSLHLLGLGYKDIDSVYISHQHGDHIGGLEQLGLCTLFDPSAPRIKLFSDAKLQRILWNKSLSGGMETLQGKRALLTDFFDCQPVARNGHFDWEGIRFDPIQTVHIVSDKCFQHSYGLLIQENKAGAPVVFCTTDTQFAPNQIQAFYDKADLILQDCETSPFPSKVHAHFNELKTLPETTKQKMYLYHYQPGGPETFDAPADGFGGFIFRGQEFWVSPDEGIQTFSLNQLAEQENKKKA